MLILEARGLDVTPAMIRRLRTAADNASADILAFILSEEIYHVACGKNWFFAICHKTDREPIGAFYALRRRYFAAALKPPLIAPPGMRRRAWPGVCMNTLKTRTPIRRTDDWAMVKKRVIGSHNYCVMSEFTLQYLKGWRRIIGFVRVRGVC
jgi:hypothetical protein